MAKSGINQKKAAKEFAEKWCGRGDEKQDTQAFWTSLLRDVFGVANPEDSIQFEKRIKLGHTSFIDAYIPSTKVLIEQKSIDVDLLKPAKQSDGTLLTPYQQGDRYRKEQNYSEAARWIVTCNFKEFFIYDMDHREAEPEHIFLKDLDKDFNRLQFLADQKNAAISREEEISLKAGELVGKLYDAILKQYKDPESAETLKSLNVLCVRLVFLLYAEDAGIFAEKDMFGRYLAKFRPEETREKILNLFNVLNTKPEDRDPYLSDDLAAFPYVNGGLFAEQSIEIPRFNEEIVDILVNKASAGFDWSEISPTIFGAVFESTLNPETRRKGGMHYTSIANIHKVIDPLFLDDLRAEFAKIIRKNAREPRALRQKLEDFRNKLAGLTFLDPACGSGNFLTETYISLRRLENECLKVIHGSQMLLSSKDFSPIKVKISQFYGIEINDFAVTVAKTALWIAESQMMKETEEIVEQNLDFLPLSTSATIVEGNALRTDWTTLEPESKHDFVFADKLNVYKIDEKSGINMVGEPEIPYGAHYQELNVATKEITERKFLGKDVKHSVVYDYIIGNPPFVGARFMDKYQKEDVLHTFGKEWRGVGDLDYVCCWYKKALTVIKGVNTRCAFVSTNSVTQGASVANLWKPLFAEGLHFDFAWRTFKWANETSDKKNMAAVHCVIIGFSATENPKTKIIFTSEQEKIEAENINGYLMDSPDLFIENRKKPLCAVSEMVFGSMPNDGRNLIIEADEYDDFVKNDPASQKYIHRFLGADEFLNFRIRYCLWLVNATPAELRRMPLVFQRVGAVRKLRESSSRAATRKLAETPWLFGEIRQPESGNYLLVPRVSSENRKYIPIGFINSDVIASDANFLIPDATLYEFGIMTSNVHNAWMRAVCGRLESRYRYSASLVYNNFPWPNLSDCCAATSPKRRGKDLKADIEETAQAILDARAKYPDSSLADLYDETSMPPELRKTHKENDKAVMAAYGFNQKMTETEIVAELFKMYEKLS
ncbi:class I SAM-dependent DNA methyltransferase [bacterium]|nr:class I SAM-dependent DNA methyltransferase [bacterium]